MGNDGGSIPTRRELVKEAARNPTTSELKELRQEQQEYHWTTDPISQKPLAEPVVSDANGKLYNKETILEYLVDGARKEDFEAATAGAITGLKDIVEVKFETDADASAKGGQRNWKCPVTGDRLGPGSKAVYLVPCGHAFSGTAIKEVSGERCVTCDTEYASNDVIPILPTAETDIARLSLRAKGLREKGLTHSLKKASGGKKRKKRDEGAGDAESEATNGVKLVDVKDAATPRTSTPVNGDAVKNGTAAINNSSAASVTAKVKHDQEAAKKRKMESENVRSLFSSRDKAKGSGNSGDFMTRGYTVGNGVKR